MRSLLILLLFPAVAAAQTVECAEPNVLLVFDVSGSMGKAVAGTKYTLASNAITAATSALDDDVRFGLLMFPEATQAPAVHCSLDPVPQIGFAVDNGPAIFDLIDASGANFWGGPTSTHDTPMFQALSAAADLGDLQDPERRSYVVLITDGKQDCCIAGDYDDDPDCEPGSTTLDEVEAQENILDLVAVVSDLNNDHVQTFVVGLQDGVSALALNKMALAGGTVKDPACNPNQTNAAAADNCYYVADDALSLEQALGEIAQIIAVETCDGIDNDCDGDIDEDFDVGNDCDGDDQDLCDDGITICSEDTASVVCDEPGPGLLEECDKLDNDCDGATDEDNPCPVGFLCLGGTCIGDAEDDPDTPDDPGTEEPDAGSTADAEDQPANPEPTPDAGSSADVEDQPANPEPTPDAGPAIPLPSNGQAGGEPEIGGAGGDDETGCGCRTVGGSRPVPLGGPVAGLIAILLIAGLRGRGGARQPG